MAAEIVRGLPARLRESGGTVRVRTTIGAVAVVGLALVVAAVAMVALLRRSLTEDVRVTADLRAEAVADQLAGTGSPARLSIAGDDDGFVQVLDRHGDVVAASENVAAGFSSLDLQPGESKRIQVPFDDDPFLAVAVAAGTPQGTYTVVVGRTLDNVVESSATVINLLMVGVPVLLLLVAAVTWGVVGRALAPVEAIRSQVETISTEDLDRRVPVPHTTDEIARLAATMNQMLERLEDGQARQRRFVSDASHELRSPVASIRQAAEVALAHPDGTSSRDLAGLVLAEDLRLQRLVEDLLLLTRMDEGAADDRKTIVDLDDIMLHEIDRLRRATGVTVDAGRVSAGRVRGNANRLSRMVGNLLDNAARHARDKVAVALFEQGGEVVLQVDDDGPGIPPAARGRVFERFVRLEEARDRDSGGTGLGLAIVAEVAAHQGGAATALASPLGGARFEIRLPRGSG